VGETGANRGAAAVPQAGSARWRVHACSSCEARSSSEWGALCGDDVRVLSEARIVHTYRRGQAIFYASSSCIGLHCVQQGTVAIRKTGPRGDALMLRLATRGDTLGYRTFFSGKPYAADGIALTECTVCFVPRRAVMALLESRPEVGMRFLERLARDLRESEDAQMRSATLPLRAQLVHLLLRLRDDFGEVHDDGTIILSLPMSRRDLASMLGTRPETITRLTKALEADEVAFFKGRRATIPDIDRMLDEVEPYSEA
jgi:CRP/FNR family transcriptional regulator